MILLKIQCSSSCADPESFVGGGLTLTFFCCLYFDEGKEDPNTTICGPSSAQPAKRHLNGVSLACRCWPNIESWFGSFVNFQGSESLLLRKPIFL